MNFTSFKNILRDVSFLHLFTSLAKATYLNFHLNHIPRNNKQNLYRVEIVI
jgi:hypothetical protein